MTLNALIMSYGYWAILVGTFLEGETILVLGGFAAHRGYLDLLWVIVSAFVGTLAGDQFFFFLGRRNSNLILRRRPAWKARIEKARGLLDRHGTILILVFRFLYGLRSITPFVVGMSTIPAPRFFLLNVLGALVWAVAIGTGGYIFGGALEGFLGNVKRYEAIVFLVIAILGISAWGVHFFHNRKGRRSRRGE